MINLDSKFRQIEIEIEIELIDNSGYKNFNDLLLRRYKNMFPVPSSL